ncbi:hypothetical protein Hdeb2414_s0011g00368481 [Helianthus debilis subsp. tardiflorus]
MLENDSISIRISSQFFPDLRSLVEKMKATANQKVNEERRRLQSGVTILQTRFGQHIQ